MISRMQISNDDKPIEGVMLGASNRIDAAPADYHLAFAGSKYFATVLADPPQFNNRTGKMAPEHRRLSRYSATAVEDIAALPVAKILTPTARLYLWVPNALLPYGLGVLAAWGYYYKTMIVWRKLRKDGGSDGRGVGFYFRNVTETLLFGRGRAGSLLTFRV